MNRKPVEVEGSELLLSNLGKVLYPESGFTKAQVIDYYGQVAGVMLPHLKGRALTLKRFPDGVGGEYFFEKRCPAHRPPWVATAEVFHHGVDPLAACVVEDLKSLVWVANLAALELHVPLARAATPDTPDSVVFDLDPGEGADVLVCARVALLLRDLFSRLGLEAFVKSSGQKGLHVFVPLNLPGPTFEDAKTFSRAVALTLEKSRSDLVTSKMPKEERAGKVFINWSQNDPGKTMVCAYSLRGGAEPFVSLPLAWEEVEGAVAEEEGGGLRMSAPNALGRVRERGDLFAGMLTKRQRLPRL